MQHNLVPAFAVALLMAAAGGNASTAINVYNETDTLDLEGVHIDQDTESDNPFPDWLKGWYYMDTIGADFTLGTSEDPIAQELDTLRDVDVASPEMDVHVRSMQLEQRGWIEANVSFTVPAGAPSAPAIVIEPGEGWFPSLQREADWRSQNGASVVWEPRTVGARSEHVDVTWEQVGGDCPTGKQRGDALLDSSPLDRQHAPGSAESEDTDLTPMRNDRVAFSLRTGGMSACDVDVTFDIALEFVHETDANEIQTSDAVGYMRETAHLEVCRFGYAPDTGCSAPPEYRYISNDPMDILYAPIFPIGYALQLECTHIENCLDVALDRHTGPVHGALEAVVEGDEMVVIGFDKDDADWADMRLFSLETYTFRTATGTSGDLTLL